MIINTEPTTLQPTETDEGNTYHNVKIRVELLVVEKGRMVAENPTLGQKICNSSGKHDFLGQNISLQNCKHLG